MVKAIGHPLRMKLLGILNQKVASPRELAEQLGEPLGNVSYHVRILADLGAVELVRAEPRRGAVEHYYRALMRPWFNQRDWDALPTSLRHTASDAILEYIWRDTAAAVEAGAFDEKTNRHLSRTPLILDDEAFQELEDLLAKVIDRALELEAESASRLSESPDEEGMRTRLVLMHYLAPPSQRSSGQRTKAPRRRGKSRSRT
jgi:DNA-binding transcriptional ArsR family regulator